MENQFTRTEYILGKDNLAKIKNANIAVFGVGGVGGFCVEALARAGVGKFTLVDNDTVSITNLNRQIIALHTTVGMLKTEVMKNRISDINPEASVCCKNMFYLPENAALIDLTPFDYVIDAIDTVSAKIELIVRCDKLGVPIISSMGTGNKLNPFMFEVADIYKTSVCPLARVMRRELKARNIKKLKVIYSKEEPIFCNIPPDTEMAGKRSIPGSISYCPSVAGLLLASEVISDILKK